MRSSAQRGRAALGVACLLALTAKAEEPAPVTLSVEEAVARALVKNPQAVAAEGAVRTAAAAERRALGAYLPSASASAGAAYSSSERYISEAGTSVRGASGSYNAGVSASWDVFTGFRRGADRRQAAAQTEVAVAGRQVDRAEVALQVERAFYEALRAKELAHAGRARVQRAEEGRGAAERRMKVGSATRSDLLRAQLELNTAKQAVLEQETRFRTASYALGRQVGVEARVEPRAEPSAALTVSREPVAGDEVVKELSASAPLVRSSEAAQRAAEASVAAARSRYFPTLQLSTGYDVFNQDPAVPGLRSSWAVRLGLTIPIFDRFVREEAVERARVQATVSAAQATDAHRAIRAEAERTLGEVRLAGEKVVLAQEAVQVAEEDLRVQQDRYRLGVTTMLDLLTSQTNLVDAENGLVSARYDYQLARAELASLAGRGP